MKQLPGIIMAIIATVIILVALIMIGLRIALPHLDKCSPQIVSILNSAFNTNIRLHQLHGSWQYFGPTLDIYGIEATTTYGRMYVQHATLALDVWQSLRHWRWKFRHVLFYSLQFDLKTNLINSNYNNIPIRDNLIDDLFLRQFDKFILRNSHLTFITSAGRLCVLSVPQLIWFNTVNKHCAEGKIIMSSNEQHGMIKASIELHDNNGLIKNGKLYLNTWNINLQQLFLPLIKTNTNITLQRTYFHLSACLTIDNSKITGAHAMLSQGIALLDHNYQSHRFDVDKLSIKLYKQQDAWQLDVPALNIAINGQSWSPTAISIFWVPAKCNFFLPDQTGEIGLRISRLKFERFNPILSLISVVTPKLSASWYKLQPCGKLTSLALDIPIKNTSATRFQAEWYNISWRPWQLMPGVENISGSVSGSLAAGRLKFSLQNSMLPYPLMFRAPLAISNAYATIDWRHHQQDGLILWGHHIDIRAQSIWVKGNFSFHKSIKCETWLDILADWHLTNAADAWRYYPEPLIGKNMAAYLTSVIKKGYIANANLLFTGNPSSFPFKNNAGKFEVWAPLRQAAYIFESGWPTLQLLDIDLNFVNNGLFMYTPQIMLGKNISKNISANIPDFSKKKLLIHAHINSSGSSIRDYFLKNPLKLSLCKTLEELQLSGVVMGDLYLDIPLNNQLVTASGKIVLNNNSLYIKSLSTTFESLNGKLYYSNGNLTSYAIDGKLFGQPIVINVTSIKKSNGLNINIGIKGNWSLKAFPNLPRKIRHTFSGHADWNSNIVITIPIKGEMRYNIAGKSNFKNINSYLPAPLYKISGTPLTLVVNIQGDMHAFLLSGHLGKVNSFNSHWLLKRQINLKRGAWEYSSKIPHLPQDKKITLSLPAIDGDQWLKLLKYPHSMEDVQIATMWLRFPETMTLRTPALTLGRQSWHQLGLTCNKIAGGMKVTAHGQEIKGTFTILNNSPWHAELAYLYYDPLIYDSSDADYSELFNTSDSHAYWQKILFTCQKCWINKKNIGRLSARMTSTQDKLILNSFVVDTGKIYFTADGHWLHKSNKNHTAFKGTLSGNDIGEAADYLGCHTLLRDAPFNINYNLHWCAAPWAPDITSIKGVLHTKLGKGKIDHISSGSAGHIIRWISFNALMRKLKLNFSDTFGKGFYFHNIKGASWLKNGKLHTNELLIDGVEANVAISGYLDLKRQHININVVIVPEILATVGLATAVIIHPVLGAAVFAASKILTPLCNKLALVRYHISGNLAMPKIK